MNSSDKAILEKFFVKESRILIGLENFGATVFSIMGGLGVVLPHQLKNDQISNHQGPLHQVFTSSPKKPFLLPNLI